MLWKTIIQRVNKYSIENPAMKGSQMLTVIARTNRVDPSVFLHTMVQPEQAEWLRRIIPEAFPKKLQRLPLKVSKNIHGKWRVDATNKEQP